MGSSTSSLSPPFEIARYCPVLCLNRSEHWSIATSRSCVLHLSCHFYFFITQVPLLQDILAWGVVSRQNVGAYTRRRLSAVKTPMLTPA